MIDLRTLSPIDMDTVLKASRIPGRLVCVDEANPRCSIAADIAANVAQGRLRRAEGADPDGDAAACAGALLARAGGYYMPRPRIAAAVARRWRTDMADITPDPDAEMGPSMREGRPHGMWPRREDRPGDEIMDVETDKIANVVEAADGGLLRRRVGVEGETYPSRAAGGHGPGPRSREGDRRLVAPTIRRPPPGRRGDRPAYQFADLPAGRIRYAERPARACPCC